MTDNRTTELLCKLLHEHGVGCQTHYFHASWCVGPKLYEAVDNLDGTLTVSSLTPEQAIAATLGNHPTKSGRGYYTDRDDDGTHIMCDDCGGYIGTAEEIAATLGEADEGCYLMYEGKKYPAELDFGFLGMMPITITVGGFRYLVEVPNGE